MGEKDEVLVDELAARLGLRREVVLTLLSGEVSADWAGRDVTSEAAARRLVGTTHARPSPPITRCEACLEVLDQPHLSQERVVCTACYKLTSEPDPMLAPGLWGLGAE